MCVSAQGEGGGKVLGRRGLGRFALTGAVALGAGLQSGSSAVSTRSDGGVRRRPVTPEGAWTELAAGNGRWRTLRERHPDESAGLRRELVGGQHPFAVVLGCVDSRVPPELVFDQGLGDLLTVRSAGEVLDEAVVGSVAYGVLELGIPLVVVLGHQACGAVAAAVHAETGHGELPGPLRYLAGQIRPSIDRTLTGDACVDAAVTANVRRVAARLAAQSEMAGRIAAGKLAVVGARYELAGQWVHRVG
ncbi:carbonic anhydrase [Streptomyces sp. NPDC012746]|uniref:carbonic anhydrase n=1 Tax=Streptomyces sp. NPDC012746 TaxID=3364845 RepID=UPI003676614B